MTVACGAAFVPRQVPRAPKCIDFAARKGLFGGVFSMRWICRSVKRCAGDALRHGGP